MAEEGQYKNLMIDTAENSYSAEYLKKYRVFYPILGRVGKPKDFERFLIQADSCLRHDARSELDRIKCPTLVIGGSCDKIAGADASVELNEKKIKSELIIYQGLRQDAY
jgi:pimeloyl-ACP methyl ester carboxylesterase